MLHFASFYSLLNSKTSGQLGLHCSYLGTPIPYIFILQLFTRIYFLIIIIAGLRQRRKFYLFLYKYTILLLNYQYFLLK